MLPEIEEIATFIELDERTGNLRAVCNFACDEPALRFRQTGGLRIEPHWAPVPGTAGEHEDGDYCDNQGNESGKDRVVGHRGEGNRGWLFIDIHAPDKGSSTKKLECLHRVFVERRANLSNKMQIVEKIGKEEGWSPKC